jgi:hypothetical protein
MATTFHMRAAPTSWHQTPCTSGTPARCRSFQTIAERKTHSAYVFSAGGRPGGEPVMIGVLRCSTRSTRTTYSGRAPLA